MTFSRRREFWLLLLVFVIIGLGYAVIWQSYLPVWKALYHGKDWQIFVPPASMFVGWLAISIALTVRRCRETLLVPLVALLIGLGLLFLLRLAAGEYLYLRESDGLALFASYYKQLISLGIGMVVLLAMILGWRDYRALSRFKYLIAATAVILLLVTTFFGREVGGAMVNGQMVGGQTIGLKIGSFMFQPHEPVKLLIVIFLAAYLVEKQELISFAAGKHGFLTKMDFRYMGPLVALWLLVMGIIFLHDDLGAAVLLFGAFLGMLYIGTQRKVYLMIGLSLAILGGGFAYLHSTRVQHRVAIWQNPWPYENKGGYQICQALMALGNGRVVGAGLGAGSPERIPAVHTDMIYAAMSEDLGLLGAVFIVGIFLVVITRIFTVALRTDDRFGKLLASGLAITLGIQTWVILAGVVKLIPLTGITLPFISYGGTSLVVNLILLGIVLKICEEPVALAAGAETQALPG